MKKIQKNAARFDNLKQDFLDDKKYSGTAEATLNGYRYDITRFLKFLSDEQLAVNEAGFKRYVIHLTDSGMTAHSTYLSSRELVTIVGNLVENAFEAVKAAPSSRWGCSSGRTTAWWRPSTPSLPKKRPVCRWIIPPAADRGWNTGANKKWRIHTAARKRPLTVIFHR